MTKRVSVPVVDRPRQAHANLQRLVERGRAAKECGFTIEPIIARQYIIESWLRRLIVHRTGRPVTPGLRFGTLIKRAGQSGLKQNLVRKLNRFNRERMEAVHGLLDGARTYESLSDVFAEDGDKLPTLVKGAVRKIIGSR